MSPQAPCCAHLLARVQQNGKSTTTPKLLDVIREPVLSSPLAAGLRNHVAADPSAWHREPALLCLDCGRLSTAEDASSGCSRPTTGHPIHLDVQRMELFCTECRDYVYHRVFDQALTGATSLWGWSEMRAATEQQDGCAHEDLLQTDMLAGPAPLDLCLAPAPKGESGMPLLSHDGLPLGLRGLANLGNTCFMNSVLQALLHAPLLRNYFLGGGHTQADCRRKRGRPCLSCELDGVFSAAYDGGRAPVAPAAFLYAWWRSADHGLAGYQQQDAHEFYLSALAGLSAARLNCGSAPAAPRLSGPELRPAAGAAGPALEPHGDSGDSGFNVPVHALSEPACSIVAPGAFGEALGGLDALLQPLEALPGERRTSSTSTSSAELTEAGSLIDSVVQRVFGGLLRSDVTCCECGYTSTAHDPFLDISLDLRPPPPRPPALLARPPIRLQRPAGTRSHWRLARGSMQHASPQPPAAAASDPALGASGETTPPGPGAKGLPMPSNTAGGTPSPEATTAASGLESDAAGGDGSDAEGDADTVDIVGLGGGADDAFGGSDLGCEASAHMPGHTPSWGMALGLAASAEAEATQCDKPGGLDPSARASANADGAVGSSSGASSVAGGSDAAGDVTVSSPLHASAAGHLAAACAWTEEDVLRPAKRARGGGARGGRGRGRGRGVGRGRLRGSVCPPSATAAEERSCAAPLELCGAACAERRRPPGAVTLLGCLQRYVRAERLGPAQAWTCARCQTRRPAVKQMSIRRLPPVLCLHLKRFEHTGVGKKLETPLLFPATLDAWPYLSASVLRRRRRARPHVALEGADAAQSVEAPGRGSCYELYAVVCHRGNLQGGHYIAYVKCGGAWYECNDAVVVRVDEATARRASAYMLYYCQPGLRP